MLTLVLSHSAQDPITARLCNALRPVLGTQAVATAIFDACRQFQGQAEPAAVLVVLPADPERGLECVRQCRAEYAGPLLAVGKATDPRLILRALQYGANHYLDQADLEVQLEGALSQLLHRREGDAPAGRLLGVMSVSGGCGASTIAVNIAAARAKEHGRCGLVDLNPGRGDLAALLDLRPSFTLADVCQNEPRLDKAMLDKMLVRHPCGVSLLASPPLFADARSVTPRGVAKALTLARKSFSDVVVDLEDCFHDEQVATVQQATGILLVCRLDFTSLRNARKALDQMKRLGVPRHRLKLVINQFGQPNELPVDEAEDALGEKLTRFVPHDPKTVYAANNTGVPAVVKAPQTKVAQALVQLSQIVFEKDAASCVALQRPQLPKL